MTIVSCKAIMKQVVESQGELRQGCKLWSSIVDNFMR